MLVTRIVAKAHNFISAGNAKRHEVFKNMGYLPAHPSDMKLRVLPSYTFVPMSEVEQHVQQMVRLKQCLNLIVSATCPQQSAKLPSLPISASN